MRNPIIVLFCLLFFNMNMQGQDSTDRKKVKAGIEKPPSYTANPAAWINDCYNQLNGIYLYQTEYNLDSLKLFDSFRANLVIITMLKKDFYGNSGSLNIRSVYNMKMRMADILSDITQWQRKIHNDNELMVENARVIIRIKNEITGFRAHADSLFRINFVRRTPSWNLS